jgi:Ser/Thr protein kinase RdoA (MazF antagonist)
MEGTHVMPERQAVTELFQAWHSSAGTLLNCEPMQNKETVWLLTTTGGERLVLKEVGTSVEASRLESYYPVWVHLAACGIPVAVPYLSDAGSRFVPYQDHLYSVSPYLPAHTRIGEKHGWANENIGKAIGALHRALASYEGENDSWHLQLLPLVLEEVMPRLLTSGNVSEPTRLAQTLGDCERAMRQAYSNLPEQVIHGDCHTGNLLVQEGQVVGFLDLDHLWLGPRIYDLGYLLADQVKSFTQNREQTSRWLQHLPALLRGYERVTRLSTSEKEALWPVLLAVQLMMSDWFSQHHNLVLAELNLQAFYWFYEHKEEIMKRLAQALP